MLCEILGDHSDKHVICVPALMRTGAEHRAATVAPFYTDGLREAIGDGLRLGDREAGGDRDLQVALYQRVRTFALHA